MNEEAKAPLLQATRHFKPNAADTPISQIKPLREVTLTSEHVNAPNPPEEGRQ
jgi:hypothetical protein